MFKSLFSSLFVISVIRNNQTICRSRCSAVSLVLWQAPRGGGCWGGAHAPEPRGAALLLHEPWQAAAPGTGDPGKGGPEAEGGGGRGREGRRGRVQGRTSRLKSQDTDASAFCQQSRARRNLLPCWQLLLVMEVGCSPSSSLQMFLLPWQEHPNTSSKWELSCSGG